MKIICTTSDKYLHIIPIFCYLFNRYWGEPVEIVGYEKPTCELPPNFTFHSLGKQTNLVTDFSNDLMKYFAEQDEFFIWLMEDTFIKNQVNFENLDLLKSLTSRNKVGRINISGECYKQDFTLYDEINGHMIYENPPLSEYRLSTQVSIWSRDFLLRYLTKDMSPWDFECQPKVDDGFHILGMNRHDAPVVHNEGVRKRNIFEYNFNGVEIGAIEEMEKLKLI